MSNSPSEQCYCLTCGVPKYEFSDKEIDAMRSALAKQWRQSKSQVTDYEAVAYLRYKHPLEWLL